MFDDLLNQLNGHTDERSTVSRTLTVEEMLPFPTGGSVHLAGGEMITLSPKILDQLEQGEVPVPEPARFHIWHNSENRRKFLKEYYPALALAAALERSNQVAKYQERIADLVNLDRAERVQELIRRETGYVRLLQSYPRALPKKQFTLPIKTHTRWSRNTQEKVREVWQFKRIRDHRKTLPLHALEAMMLLKTEGIDPDDYWVGKKVEKVTPVQTARVRPRTRRTSLPDPVLAASFGRHVVTLAEWE